MAGNKTLGSAKTAKKDEWYTQLEDIEKEMVHYRDYFRDKVVFCNCDDPYESNFFKYFAMNFNFLGLRKLISTCYVSSPIVEEQLSLFDVIDLDIKNAPKLELYPNRHPYKIEITEVNDANKDGRIDIADVEFLLKNKKNALTLLDGDGDFRSSESIKILKEADIVCTNPPFSLFREYIAQLIEYNKKFIVIGRMTALHYKEVFSLLKDNIIWTGYGFNLSLVYKTPYKNTEEANKKFVRSKGYNPDDGYVKVPGICWYTNVDIEKRHENLILYCNYNKDRYPKYDNFEAINIDKISEIPCDYFDIMGVPDTIFDGYNPDQFDIIGRSGDTDWVFSVCDFFTPPSKDIQNSYKKQNNTWRVQNVYLLNEKKMPKIVYSRIFIKRKV